MNEINATLHIYSYNSKKSDYFITYFNKKPYFVLFKNNAKERCIKRVNIKKEREYMLYKGVFTIINDLIFIK